MDSKIYKTGFNFLSLYLEKKYGIRTFQISGAEDAWFPHIKRIIINKDLQWRDRLLALIHESGHVQIDYNFTGYKFKSVNQDNINVEKIKSKKQFITVLNEELMAWNFGKNLAHELNITFDVRRLEEMTTKCLMSYVKSGLKGVYGKKIDIEVIDPGL